MRFRHLDFLRFIFALYVVGWHSFGSNIGFLANAGLAVDFFFILSGFVLTQLVIKRHPTFPEFCKLRFARLWPMHITTGIAAVLVIPNFYIPHLKILFLQLTLLQIISPEAALKINIPAWSISAELVAGCGVFYFVATKRLFFASIFLVALTGYILLSIGYRFDNLNDNPVGPVTAGLIRCVMEMLLGYVAYEIYLLFPKSVPLVAAILQVSLLVGMVATIALATENVGRIGGVVCAFLMIIAMASWETAVTRLLSKPVLGYLGDLSFGVYLIHGPVLWFLMWRGYMPWKPTVPHDLPIFLLAFSVIMLLSVTAHHTIELSLVRFLSDDGRKHPSKKFLSTRAVE